MNTGKQLEELGLAMQKASDELNAISAGLGLTVKVVVDSPVENDQAEVEPLEIFAKQVISERGSSYQERIFTVQVYPDQRFDIVIPEGMLTAPDANGLLPTPLRRLITKTVLEKS